MIKNRYTQYMYSYPHKTAYRPLEGLSLRDYASYLSGPGHGLYLHVPFCQSKCGYCNLFSVTGQKAELTEEYLGALKRQLFQYQELLSPYGTRFSDFTIGGGTPLLLSASHLESVFTIAKKYLTFDEQLKIVIETAPNQTTREKLAVLKANGVTRVSMGIQSFSDEELKILRRSHRAEKAREALTLLMEFHFPCVNVDFIYGIPGQTVKSLLSSLKEAAAYHPEELFLYPLYIKHGVSMEQDIRNGLALDEKLAFLLYKEARAFLLSNGYVQDSMRRFVKRGLHKENRTFQDCSSSTSLALGCGGRSYLGNLHFCTPYETNQTGCLKVLKDFICTEDFTSIPFGFLLSEDEVRRRYVIRHLFILPGLKKSGYYSRFHSQAMVDFPLLKEWQDSGYLKGGGDYYSLTEEGLGLSDWLGPQLISPDVRRKMEEWDAEHEQAHDFIPGKPKKL